ncbi:MAG: flavodoxin domain-containing protein [Candidatus Limnocylindrales bacterium]
MTVLVTAASRHGTTSGIGDAIAAVLRAADLEVDVRSPGAIEGIADYDAVVIGSAVYGGRWLEPARAFVARHADALAERPVFLFSSGPLGDPPRHVREPSDLPAIRAAIHPRDHRLFQGRLTESALRTPERLLAKLGRAPFGDFRPWDEIMDWAWAIARSIREAGSAPSR